MEKILGEKNPQKVLEKKLKYCKKLKSIGKILQNIEKH